MNSISRAMSLCVFVVFQAFGQTPAAKTPAAQTPPAATTTEKPAPAASPALSSSPYSKQAAISQTADVAHLTANSPRPLVQTLDALELKYGWVVDYEDPRFTSPMDSIEAPNGGVPGSRVPAGATFTVDFPANSPDEEKTLRAIVDAYNQSKNPGRFELRRFDQGNFYLVGTGAHDEKGAISPQQVLFDLPITIPAKERTIADTIDLICQTVAKQGHVTVTVGITPRNLVRNPTVKIGGTKVPARELLLQCLMATHHDLYWRLLFNPGPKSYVLNIHGARPT